MTISPTTDPASTAARVGLRAALLHAAVGNVLAFAIAAAFGVLRSVVSREPVAIVLAGIALYGVAAFAGRAAGRTIATQRAPAFVVGVLVALATLLATVIVGSLGAMVSDGSGDVAAYVGRTLYWVTLFGTLPAVVLGLLFGRQVRRAIAAA